MEGISKQLQHKWIRFAVITAIFLLGGIILLIMTTPPTPQKVAGRLTGAPITLPVSDNPFTKGTTPVFHSKGYSVSYPVNWLPDKLLLTNGGEFTTIRPATLEAGAKEYYPSFIVAVEPTTGAASIQSKASIYERFGMQKTQITFHGMPATKVSGTFPIRVVQGIPTHGNVQKTLIFFQKGGNVYTVKYYYDSGTVSPADEQFFNQLLTTFSF